MINTTNNPTFMNDKPMTPCLTVLRYAPRGRYYLYSPQVPLSVLQFRAVCRNAMSVGVVVRGLKGRTDPTIIFMHGWPDTDEVFAQQYGEFESTHRLVSLVIPGYRGNKTPFWGLDFADVVKQTHAAVVHAMEGQKGKPLLIAHDWGAIIANELILHEPDLFQKIVFLDVGCHTGKRTIPATLMVLAYQWVLMFAFLLPAVIGTPITQFMARLLGAPKTSIPSVHSGMNYLYVQIWKRIVTRKIPASLVGWHVPKQPVLFLYGTKKPFMFHSQRFVDHLRSTKGSDAIAIDGSHWFFTSTRHAPKVNAAIRQFVDAK
jgi:pimeloyl-ACP methyl ester carboxylesterase